MLLSEILGDFLRKHRKTRAFKRGVGLYGTTDSQMTAFGPKEGYAEFVVPSQTKDKEYAVELFNLQNPKKLKTVCECPFDWEPVCKHAFAALHHLVDELETYEDGLPPTTTNNITPNLPSQKVNGPLSIQKLFSFSSITQNEYWVVQRWFTPEDLEINVNEMSGTVGDYQGKFKPVVKLSPDNTLSCECTCIHRGAFLCMHGFALLYHSALSYGFELDVLHPIRNHSETYAELLAAYGFTVEDDWRKHFRIGLQDMEVSLEPIDSGLSKIAKFASWKKEVKNYVIPPVTLKEQDFLSQTPDYGILWSFAPHKPEMAYLNLLLGKRKKDGALGAPLRMVATMDRGLNKLDKTQRGWVERLYTNKVMREFGGWNGWEGPNYGKDASEDFEAMNEQLSRLREIYPLLLQEEHYLCDEPLDQNTVTSGKIRRMHPKTETPVLSFEIIDGETHILLKPVLKVGKREVCWKDTSQIAYGIISLKDNLYILDADTARTSMFFEGMEAYKVPKDDFPVFMQEFVVPLMNRFEVRATGIDLAFEILEATPEKKVYLKEMANYLVLVPKVVYTSESGESREVSIDGGKRITFEGKTPGSLFSIERDTTFEAETRASLEALHPMFSQSRDHYFSIPASRVMEKNWFFKAFEQMKNDGFEILGLKELKKLKYSPHRPQVSLQASSGTDWFDLKVEVTFGDQTVKLAEIRKAVLNNNQYVKLGDGSIGILPDEWLKKYSSLFKIGKVNKGKLSVSQFQLSLIDDLYDEIDNSEVFEEILEKRRRLQEFKEIKQVSLPRNLTATLRNYQKEGYNWLNFLDEFGWGGCLADDMGLGKTVQMLAFLMNISAKHPGVTHLVIVPKSLVFNWIKEVEKFCPGFKTHRHTGVERTKNIRDFLEADLVITTYGLVRSDIEFFVKCPFHYVVLDESQAIKNPNTKTAKAVKLLNAKNRLIMTGTPVENNTFDLYSQMDFLNPGMLGSLDGFRREFATPIDKNKDEFVAQELRKLVYPFILSRKKKEVAKDLPEKTETILYCEMPPAQRKVYDHFKDKYRNMLMAKFEAEGYSGAGVYILQGLLKLRQICNSPQILNGEEGVFTEESAKMEVLAEMLDEIVSEGHKVLVFSFFKGMLNLVSEALDEKGIGYVMLTGESNNREALVNSFKQDENKKVFLISLKAGGFGLNLEEANYVFMVDPWWNPAVEQQAIDRSHRIGQTQKVFAYKMICKDSIEEKILKLQERKLALASDIIHTESGFLKSLRPEDVVDLFG